MSNPVTPELQAERERIAQAIEDYGEDFAEWTEDKDRPTQVSHCDVHATMRHLADAVRTGDIFFFQE